MSEPDEFLDAYYEEAVHPTAEGYRAFADAMKNGLRSFMETEDEKALRALGKEIGEAVDGEGVGEK